MRILLIEPVFWKDSNKQLEAGHELQVLPSAEIAELIESKKAIEIKHNNIITKASKHYMIMQYQKANKKTKKNK